MTQTLLSTLLVAGSAAYVLWTLLLPKTARRRIASALLRLRWPDFVTRRLQAQAQAQRPSGCSCEGCGSVRPAASAAQPVLWAPRRRH